MSVEILDAKSLVTVDVELHSNDTVKTLPVLRPVNFRTTIPESWKRPVNAGVERTRVGEPEIRTDVLEFL